MLPGVIQLLGHLVMTFESYMGRGLRGTAGTHLLALLLGTLVMLASLGGCASHRYLSVRKVPENPLAGPLNLLSQSGPRPTDRTMQTLRRYDLDELQREDPAATLTHLQQEIRREPTPDKLHAFSELAYITGYQADVLGKDNKALNLYGAAAFYAYGYLFDPCYDSLRNPYDPQFRRACDVYNESLEAALRLIRSNGQLLPGESLLVETGSERIRIDVVARGSWNEEEFERLEFVSDYQITGLKNHHRSYGLGVPMLAIRRPGNPDNPLEKYYPETLSFPVTAFLRIIPTQPGTRGQRERRCVLELHDPLDATDTVVSDRLVPLETDLSTALGYKLQKSQENNESLIATVGLLDPAKADDVKGLYMVEPYDPNKIPVLMVHGLWSSPMTWMEMFNDLLAYPEIRRNFQFWFYLYPTGEPFWFSAAQLRSDLAEARRVLDPYQNNPIFERVVLVGHSMGGLVSIMQTLESGDHFWEVLSDKPFEQWQVNPKVRRRVAETVFFQPNPMIKRVVTIGTPHRGSKFANEYTRFLARKLIQLPSNLLWTAHQMTVQNPGFFDSTELLTISTSIDSLAPDCPVFPAMFETRRAPWTEYHNVVGVVEENWLLSIFSEYGDGVVSFESAHREDFSSELVVNADHVSVHAHPRTVLEVRRILLKHLHEMSATPPQRPTSLASHPAASPRPAAAGR